MKKIAKVSFVIIAAVVFLATAAGFYVKTALPDVGPAPDLKVQITPARLERGRYLCTTVAACLVCHSSRDTGLFAGPIEPGTRGQGGERFGPADGLPGNVYAPNLTPYHLADWTDGQLFRAITTGVSRDGHALFPLMNYPAYGRLAKEDIVSIIAYLRRLPPIRNDVPPTRLNFPVSLLVNTMPQRASLTSRPDSADSIACGKYLVTMASCVDCHSPVAKGRIVAGMAFAGGRDFGSPGGPVLRSPNLTPDKETGIGGWSREMFVRKFKQYANSGYSPGPTAPGTRNTPMPWLAFANMSEKDLGDIYAYLHSLKPVRNIGFRR